VRSPRPHARAFFLGLSTGAVYFAGTLYWLVETMTTFGGLPTALAVVAAALLVAYLALFPAAFAVIVRRLVEAVGPMGLLFAVPAWLTSELGRQYVWDGFPWELLGYSQVTWLPIAQTASLVGVYGLSALLALASSAAAIAIVGGRRRWTPAAVTIAIIAGCTLWGSHRIAAGELTSGGASVRVAVLQGNVEQDQKWDPALVDQISNRYFDMSRQAISKHLRVMSDAGLAKSDRRGRETVWELEQDGLADAERYLRAISKDWDEKLARLKHLVEAE